MEENLKLEDNKKNEYKFTIYNFHLANQMHGMHLNLLSSNAHRVK